MALDVMEYLKSLPPERQEKIMAEARRMHEEVMTFREIRKARKMTQTRVAKDLGITQDGVSRLEKRSDVLLSTLRKAVSSLGGELSLVVKFPDREQVVLAGFADQDSKTTAPSTRNRTSQGRVRTR